MLESRLCSFNSRVPVDEMALKSLWVFRDKIVRPTEISWGDKFDLIQSLPIVVSPPNFFRCNKWSFKHCNTQLGFISYIRLPSIWDLAGENHRAYAHSTRPTTTCHQYHSITLLNHLVQPVPLLMVLVFLPCPAAQMFSNSHFSPGQLLIGMLCPPTSD